MTAPDLQLVAPPWSDHDGHGPGRPGYLYLATSPAPSLASNRLDKALARAGVTVYRHLADLFVPALSGPKFFHEVDDTADLWHRHQSALVRADTVIVVDQGVDGWGHMELGYAAGAGKRTAVLLASRARPWPAWQMVDYLAPTVDDLIDWLGLDSDRTPA